MLAGKIGLAVVPATLDQDYLRDGVVEGILYALSTDPALFVVAGASSFRFRGCATDSSLGRALGVGHVLEVDVRPDGERVMLEGRLIEAASSAVIRTFLIQGGMPDIQTLQAEFAATITGAIIPARPLHQSSIATRTAESYDLYLRGSKQSQAGTRESMRRALSLFKKAVSVDEDFALAHAMIAWCHFWRKAHGWMNGPEELDEGIHHARHALELDGEDALVLTRCGHSLVHLAGDLDSGMVLLDKACRHNPNLMPAWFLGGWGRAWHGDPDDAIERFEQAARLSPADPEMFRIEAGTAMSHLFAGRTDLASSWADRAFPGLPSAKGAPGIAIVLAVIAASHALADKGEKAARALQLLRQLMPVLTAAAVRDWLPVRRAQDLALVTAGLVKAGLPD